MTQWKNYFFFLLWFAYSIISSVLLFTRGFLLTKDAQLINSTCQSFKPPSCNFQSDEYCFENLRMSLMHELHQASHLCLPQNTKVVLILIDALRHDFTVYNSSNYSPLPFQNKLPIINTLLKKHPSTTRLYKFIADPPTTTMQRLKALTTGSLPTFVDAGSNFATSQINEDNLIDQMINQNKNIVFMGDDTWISLFPNRFLRSYAYPSFNVFDLDTVDNNVIKNLYPELKKSDWNLLIGHFLGIDHCGHRYGPAHSEMARKLTEMNKVIETVVEHLNEDSLLFVIGDHGMTATGDHGGDSPNEITSAMFVYSKISLTSIGNSSDNVVKQVDLVPTLSTILGVPIPYSNLGSLIVNSLPVNSKLSFNYPHWQILLFSIWANVQQITHYIKDYAAISNTFSIDRLQELYEKFALLNARVRTIRSENEFLVFSESAHEYMKMLRLMCEEIWIQFDSYSMSRGLVLLFMMIFLVYIIFSGISTNQLPQIFMSSFLCCSYMSLIFALIVSVICFYVQLVENLMYTILFSTGIVSIFMLSILVIQNWDVIAMQWHTLSKNRTSTDLVCRLIFLFSWSGLLSNSYIVEEGFVSHFLLLSIIFVLVYETSNKLQKKCSHNFSHQTKISKWNWKKLKIFGLVVLACTLLKLSTYFWKCREEQQWCAQYFNRYLQEIKFGVITAKTEYVLSLLAMAIFVTLTRNLLRSNGNLKGFSPAIITMRYAPTVMVVCIGGYWILHKLPKETNRKLMSGWSVNYLAYIAYGSFFMGIATLLFKPLYIYILRKQEKDISAYSENVIPHLFQHIKSAFNKKNEERDIDVPVIYGLATVYSAAFISLSVYICLLTVLLLGDVSGPSFILLYFTTIIILIVTAALRSEFTPSDKLFEVPNSLIMTWMLLSVYFFYGTGHQATFPNIAWEAAFVGTEDNFSSNIGPATLVIINTFGSYIIMGLTLPTLVVFPFTVFVTYPNIMVKKLTHLGVDTSSGEMLLYENDGLMITNAFVVSCKYILFHAFRVFVCMLAATIHCRHLMVWKIFAPKLIFEGIGILVTLSSVLLGYLFLTRINYSVDCLITKLKKQRR